ncbi:MAG: hypothetical protein ABJC09_16995, partial [Terriglobia bacterium]
MTPVRSIASLLVFMMANSLFAQQSSPQAIRAAVADLPIGGRMTVKTNDGRELHGYLSAIDSDTFTFREVDLKTPVTLRYDEVAKIAKDFGRKGFAGRRVSPRRSLIAGLALLGGLVVLIAVV